MQLRAQQAAYIQQSQQRLAAAELAQRATSSNDGSRSAGNNTSSALPSPGLTPPGAGPVSVDAVRMGGKYPTLLGPAQMPGSPAVDDAAGSEELDTMGGSAKGLPAVAGPVSGGSSDVGTVAMESQPQVEVIPIIRTWVIYLYTQML